MEPLVWAALLVFLGMALVIMEVFIPTAGLLGFLSVTAILSGIFLAFYTPNGGLSVGFAFIIVTAVALPAVLTIALRILPKTPLGRRMLPGLPKSDEVLPDNEERRALRGLLGKVGRAKSPMLPSGAVVIEGRIINAMSQGEAIDAGQTIVVIEVRGTRVVVRPLADGEQPPQTDDPLSRSIDSLGIDMSDDPLG
jgi:membrane-bound ClpP family serine protease